MSFGIEIEVDANGAITSINRVEKALDGVEQKAKKAGAEGTKATRETGLAAEDAKRSADNLAKAFGGLNAELQREAAILDRLRGPSLRYNEDLKTLDRMLDQNKISVAEYTAELTKMNRALEGASIASNKVKPPDMKKQLGGVAKLAGGLTAGAGGMLSGVEAGLAVGGGLGLAVAAAPVVQKLGEVAMDAADRGLTKLANVLNADFIAMRKANEQYIARIEITRVLIEEEKKTADAIKASQVAGSGLAAVNEDVAMAATKSRVALQAAFGVDLASSMSDAEKKAREFSGALEQLKNSDAAAKLARDVERAHQSLNGMGNTLRGQIDDWKDLATKVDVLRKVLAEINQRRGAAAIGAIFSGVDPTNLGTKTRGDVDIERQLRDETVKLDNVHSVYGKTVADITLKENAHRDAMSDLKAAYKDGAITAKQYREQLAALGVQFASLPPGFRAGNIGGVAVNLGMEKGGAATGWGKTQSIVDQGVKGPAAMAVPNIAKEVTALNVELAKTPALLEQLKLESVAVGMDLLTSTFKGLEDQLVSLVTTGKFSIGDLVDSILADMARLASQKLFGALLGYIGGLGAGGGGMGALPSSFGALGTSLFGGSHAFGGDYRVGGSGGPDSQRVMFNLTPGEHVRFTPPGRDPDSGGSEGGAPLNVKVVNVTDPREMVGAMESSDGERVIMNVIKRNQAALRGVFTGR